MFANIKTLFQCEKQGFTHQELAQSQVEIPQILQRYYQELGKVQALNASQNFLVLPDALYTAGDYIVFFEENQQACVWGYKIITAHESNPPVYMSYDGEVFQEDFTNMADFFTIMALFQASFTLPYQTEEFEICTLSQYETIISMYQAVPKQTLQWTSVEFYQPDSYSVVALFKNDGYYDYLVASSCEQSYDEIMQSIEKAVETL